MCNRLSYFILVVLCLTSVISNQANGQLLGQQSLSQSSYVIDKNGHLFAFGWNWAGQFGVGDKTDRNTPVEVPIPPGATRWTLVAGGAAHAIALADSDKLYAWGSNRYGQLGTGTLGEVVVPVRVQNPPGVTAWKSVTAGRDHSLALTSTGQLYAWGNNVDGQLGTGKRGRWPVHGYDAATDPARQRRGCLGGSSGRAGVYVGRQSRWAIVWMGS